MAYPTCDNECDMMGWVEAFVSNGMQDLHISHAPDADLDGTFAAFCHDEQDIIHINGWQMAEYERVN